MPPTSGKSLHQLIVLVLEPLTKIMSSKVKFKWTKIEQGDFEEIKRIVVRIVLLACDYFNKTFKSIPMLAISN